MGHRKGHKVSPEGEKPNQLKTKRHFATEDRDRCIGHNYKTNEENTVLRLPRSTMKFPSASFLVPTMVVALATAMAVVAQQQFPPSECDSFVATCESNGAV
jgi:hypothetical protein